MAALYFGALRTVAALFIASLLWGAAAAFVVSPLSSVDELKASDFRLPQQYGAFSRTQNAPPAAAAAPHNSEAMKSAATVRRAPK